MTEETRIVPYPTIVGAILSEMRERASLSQKQAAESIGVSQSALSRMELGKACTLENLLRAARAYNVPLSEIFIACDERKAQFEKAKLTVTDDIPDVAYLPGSLPTLGMMLAGPVGGLIGVAWAVVKNRK